MSAAKVMAAVDRMKTATIIPKTSTRTRLQTDNEFIVLRRTAVRRIPLPVRLYTGSRFSYMVRSRDSRDSQVAGISHRIIGQ